MKYIALIGAMLVAGCVQPTTTPSVANPGLPVLNCTVANFISDTGDADFIRNNRLKTFEIISTSDGFISNVTSREFRDSTTDYVVTGVTADRIFAQRRNNPMQGSLDQTMVVDRAATAGVRTITQTVTSTFKNLDLPTTQNVWTLACRSTG